MFLGIVVLHVLMAWGAVSGLSRQVVEAVLGPIEATIIDEMPEPQDEPPPPPPEIEAPPPFVPPPDIQINIPQQQQTTAIQQVTRERPPPTPPPVAAPPKREPVIVPPRSNPRRPLTQPEYPPSSRRAGEAGTVVLEVYVLENGRVGDARVKQSSGYPRLDEAALREVKRSWRLEPGTQDGKPVAMWGQFAVTFRLTD
ncbi:MAG: energy transducer TonB [Pseudomonadota bacterium]